MRDLKHLKCFLRFSWVFSQCVFVSNLPALLMMRGKVGNRIWQHSTVCCMTLAPKLSSSSPSDWLRRAQAPSGGKGCQSAQAVHGEGCMQGTSATRTAHCYVLLQRVSKQLCNFQAHVWCASSPIRSSLGVMFWLRVAQALLPLPLSSTAADTSSLEWWAPS